MANSVVEVCHQQPPVTHERFPCGKAHSRSFFRPQMYLGIAHQHSIQITRPDAWLSTIVSLTLYHDHIVLVPERSNSCPRRDQIRSVTRGGKYKVVTGERTSTRRRILFVATSCPAFFGSLHESGGPVTGIARGRYGFPHPWLMSSYRSPGCEWELILTYLWFGDQRIRDLDINR